MKAQSEVVSVILITGILIGVVGSIYLWGLPLIQKSKDIALLEKTENFMRSLNNKIKFIVNNGGSDQTKLDISGTEEFDKTSGIIQIVVYTEGTIYDVDVEIPLGRNPCGADVGQFSLNDPETICVKSVKLGDRNYRTTYTLRYIYLDNDDLKRTFKIDLSSPSAANPLGTEGDTITFKNTGTSKIDNYMLNSLSRTLIKTDVEISIV